LSILTSVAFAEKQLSFVKELIPFILYQCLGFKYYFKYTFKLFGLESLISGQLYRFYPEFRYTAAFFNMNMNGLMPFIAVKEKAKPVFCHYQRHMAKINPIKQYCDENKGQSMIF